MLYVECSGGARERGRMYGARAKDAIGANLETYRSLFRERFALDWEAVRGRIAPFVPVIERFDAELLEEIHGIAEGAARDPLDIVVLNARSSVTMTRSEGECTSLAYLPAEDGSDGVLLGQNWDNMARLVPVVLRVVRPGAPSVLTLTEAGTLAKIGLNEHGIGVCVNGLRTPGVTERGVPIFVMLRRVLQATSLGEAMAVITTAKREAPHNFLLAAAAGGAFDIEATVGAFDILEPTGPFLIHTNHFLSARLQVPDMGKTHTPHSVVRLWRARRLAQAAARAGFALDDLRALLSDHFDAPNSICKHPADPADPFVVQTNASVLMELGSGRMHVSSGPPCQGTFTSYELTDRTVAA
jgi:isopenicillin-N N-acyltransferase like protein